MRTLFFACVLCVLTGAAASLVAADTGSESGWRSIPLVKDGQVAPEWKMTGWGKFVTEGDVIRTDPDPRGIGLLVYTKEKFGNCQIKVVLRPKTPRSNSGAYIRIDDGILDWTKKEAMAIKRGVDEKLTDEMQKGLMAASEAEDAAWYAVHHGYEVQIMEAAGSRGTGSIYSLAQAEPLPKKEPGEWRTMVITLDGAVIQVDVDGKRVSSVDTSKELPPRKNWTEPKRDAKRPETGYIGFQTHDPGDIVYFKEVSVRPLKK